MAEYIEREAKSADVGEAHSKIKTPFAYIIVEWYKEKPYYNILWFDSANGDFHIGYGSYYLPYVRTWLEEEFEIVEDAADVVERKRGEWVVVEDRPITFYECSLCNDRWHYGAMLHMNFCPNCGADMRGDN